MGYKCELFVNEVDENLICPICYAVFQDPVNCNSGHTFCDICIKQWLLHSNRCPMDNMVINESNSLSRNLAVGGIIANLEVRCNPSVLKGEPRCIWRGRLEELENHRKKCAFQEEQCSNVNCGQRIKRREMDEHDKICGFKKVECEECKHVVMRQNLEKHKEDECQDALIPCPNKCTNAQGDVENIKRKNAEDHINNTCGKTEVGCPFLNQGCSDCVTREDVNKHVRDNMAAHMMLLAKQNASLVGICDELREQNVKLAEKNANLQDELNKFKDDLSSYVWTIQDYPSQCKRHLCGSYFRSPNFWLCGYCWNLRLYPNGDDDSKGFLTINLCMKTESGPRQLRSPPIISSGELEVSFSLSVISQSTVDDAIMKQRKIFGRNPQHSSFHPMCFSMTKSSLHEFYQSDNGTLTIKCTIHVCAEK